MEELFVEMPSVSNHAALWRAEEGKEKFKSLEFAHKFHVFLRPDNSGSTFYSGDIKVWRVGVRSKSAYSLNILFSKFRIPEGAKVFVYNPDQTEVLGSYTEQNNSELNLLPIQPVGGDELIVEYQEPINAAFKGEIEIGEVNHDFRGVFRAVEPRDPQQECHPNLICYPEDIESGSGVLLLIINGTTLCTGTLVNNSAEDATPYLLTSTHCLNKDYDAGFLANRKYDIVAGTVVAFFNYNSPVCSTNIRGPLQMTMASADSVLISERHDISLLKLKQAPPKEYQPFFLGWNAGSSPSGPFHGVHHPNGGIKKVAIDDGPLTITSFNVPRYNMEPNAHWEVRAWEIASTEGGSSGSPLLDGDKRILGTLTGGLSMCSSPRGPDIYASLYKFWDVAGSIDNPNPISYYLDPLNSQFTQLEGFNPFMNAPFTKNMNFGEDETAVTTYFQSVPMFATNNTFGYGEFAEEYYTKDNTLLEGVFISSPATNGILNMDIRIRVYSGEERPERLLHEQPYNYSYAYFSNAHFPVTTRDMRHNVENYVKFDNPVSVSGTFYISYYDANGVAAGFSVFNAEPRKIGSGMVA
ncbi:MAG: trypsin-like peptidase domain-containing protein, partial [Proteiniphilum sp.]|nr:trypsin-like peptidase domain-containing protein [Proteiniphilum sp.]